MIRVVHADCRTYRYGPRRFHALITDPPYQVGTAARYAKGKAPKDYRGSNAAATGAFQRFAAAFEGREWDNDPLAFEAATWATFKPLLLPGAHVAVFANPGRSWRVCAALDKAGFEVRDVGAWLYATGMPKSGNLKPAREDIIIARNTSKDSARACFERYGTGKFYVDQARIGTRYPANLTTDGSDAVADLLGQGRVPYFFHAKADAVDRAGTTHPTVKPVALMAWLVRLLTGPGHLVLDPFAGSGSTGIALRQEGRGGLLVEKDLEHFCEAFNRVGLP